MLKLGFSFRALTFGAVVCLFTLDEFANDDFDAISVNKDLGRSTGAHGGVCNSYTCVTLSSLATLTFNQSVTVQSRIPEDPPTVGKLYAGIGLVVGH
jgi:hypothetical protein